MPGKPSVDIRLLYYMYLRDGEFKKEKDPDAELAELLLTLGCAQRSMPDTIESKKKILWGKVINGYS